MNRTAKRSLLFDIVLICALLAIGIASLLVWFSVREEGALVRVDVDRVTVGEYPLSVDARYSLNGSTNILVIKDGYAYMEEADCPKQICVNKGKICFTGQSITCSANRVVVMIVE